MHRLPLRGGVVVAALVLAACHSAPPPPPTPPQPLGDSAAAAVRWIDSHAVPFAINDSVASADERAKVAAIVGDARVIGVSEMTEGSTQFMNVMRRNLFGLADAGVRGFVIQGPMPEAMDVDRYVRGGGGDPKRLLRALNDWRYETREMQSLVAALRAYNSNRPADQQIGFYGFEIPTAAHAVTVITSLGDAVTGAKLGQWLRIQYNCVAADEGAHWGLEGRVQDSTYWNGCRPLVKEGLDSVVALRKRLGDGNAAAANVAFAEEMARLVAHHVDVGLRRLPRHEFNAEHVLYLLNSLPANGKLLIWGGDVEMGRLTLAPSTIQTAVALGAKLGEKYRAVAFEVGDGAIHVRRPGNGRGQSGPPGLSDVTLVRARRETLEDILRRATPDAFWIDMRALPADNGGTWLKGPLQGRLVSDIYVPELPDSFLTPLEFPKFFDAVVFVKHATPVHQ